MRLAEVREGARGELECLLNNTVRSIGHRLPMGQASIFFIRIHIYSENMIERRGRKRTATDSHSNRWKFECESHMNVINYIDTVSIQVRISSMKIIIVCMVSELK